MDWWLAWAWLRLKCCILVSKTSVFFKVDHFTSFNTSLVLMFIHLWTRLILTICPKTFVGWLTSRLKVVLVVGLIVDDGLGIVIIEGPLTNGRSVAVEGPGGWSCCVIVFCIILAIIRSCSTWVWCKQHFKYHEICLTHIVATCTSNRLSSVFALSFTMHSICTWETLCCSICSCSLDSKRFFHSWSQSSILLSISTLVSARCFFHWSSLSIALFSTSSTAAFARSF